MGDLHLHTVISPGPKGVKIKRLRLYDELSQETANCEDGIIYGTVRACEFIFGRGEDTDKYT